MPNSIKEAIAAGDGDKTYKEIYRERRKQGLRGQGEKVKSQTINTGTGKHEGTINGKPAMVNRAQYRQSFRIGLFTRSPRKHDIYYKPEPTRERIKRKEAGEKERVAKAKEKNNG